MADEHSGAQPAVDEKAAEYSVLRLGAACTIREAAEIKDKLLNHLEAPAPLFIDGSAVEKVDTAGLQLLVAFSLDCMERAIPYGWPGRSQALNQAIDGLGVAPLLECPGEVKLPPLAKSGTGD